MENVSVQQGRIESWGRAACLDQVSKDVAYLNRILDHCNHRHLPSALGTHQRFNLVHLREKPCPCPFASVDRNFLTINQMFEARIVVISRIR